MIRSIIIGILSVALIGLSYWGYKEHEEKNAVLIHAENNYQRAFHELTYNMDLLHDKIGTSLAMNSSERISPQFVDIWKLSSLAAGNVSQLPLSLLPFVHTQEFLSSIGDFTYKTSVRNLDDDPLTEKELETLNHYYDQAEQIKDELRQAQHAALDNNLRWMDVELALVTNDETENTIINGFRTVEDNTGKFSEDKAGFDIMNTSTKMKEFKYITGENKTEEEILQMSKEIVEMKDDTAIQITKSGEASLLSNYNIMYQEADLNVFMDIAEQGAHPITILVNRRIKAQKLNLNDGLIEAENFLKEFDYQDMVILESKQYDNVGVFTFLYAQDDVRVFSDKVVIKVALDNGEILGLHARDYLQNHRKRTLTDKKLTIEEAKAYVNKNVEIQEQHIAIIENNLGEEVLVYEFLGILNDQTYRIFISAENGNEEKVEKLTDTELNFDANL